MAEKHIANAELAWKAVCAVPDFCKVGGTPLPFDSFRDLSHEDTASPDVRARGEPVYRVGDKIAGTESNAGAGVVSQTSKARGDIEIWQDNTSVRVNGKPSARHDSLAWINVGPAGPNALGRLVTDQGAPLGTVENGKLPCNNPPKSSPAPQKLQALKKKLAALDPDQLDQIVDFDTTNEVLDGWIKHIDVEDTGGFWNEAADSGMQGLKAVTGFAKAAVFGMGEMAYEGLKLANPAGQIHAQLDARILAEQIRLGNICAESVKRAAKGAWEGFKEPIVEAWDRGDYVEVVTRGVLEVGSLFIGIGEIKALATGGKVAAKGAEAIDDMADAAAASHRAARNADELPAARHADDAPEPKPEPEPDKPDGNDNGVKIHDRRLKELELPCFSPFNKKYRSLNGNGRRKYVKEYNRQLRRQQEAINSMSAAEYKAARDAFRSAKELSGNGRNPLAAAAQEEFREDVSESIEKSLTTSLRRRMSPARAEAAAAVRAREIMDKLVALHEPDMVAGGWHDPIPKAMGGKNVNSAIGGSWGDARKPGSRVGRMDAAADRAVAKGKGDAKMHVKLQPCTKR